MGSVATNVDILAKKANAQLVAIGICISKNYQDGYIILRERGYDLYIQVGLKKLDPLTNTIEFDEREGKWSFFFDTCNWHYLKYIYNEDVNHQFNVLNMEG